MKACSVLYLKETHHTDQSAFLLCHLVHCASYGEPVGISDGRIANSSFSASSHYFNFPPWKARLNSGDGNAWYGKPWDVKPWIQVHSGTLE